MRNTLLVIRREYLERVKTKSFLLSTILLPAFMFGITVGPSLLMARKSKTERHIVVAASDQSVADEVAKEMQSSNSGTYRPETRVVTDNQREELNQELTAGKADGYIWVTQAAIAADQVSYVASNTSDFIEGEELKGAVTAGVRRSRLKARGIDSAEADQLLKPLKLTTARIEGGKQKDSNGVGQFFASFGFAFTVYMMLIMYGMSTMRSVLEEKTSRIMEVLLASLSAKELMAGKIIGVGAVGMTQTGVWALCVALLGTQSAMLSPEVRSALSGISPVVLISLPIFFVLGYMLYSSLYAALGAMVNSEQEAQQWQFFVTMPLIIPIVMIMAIIRQPDSAMSVWLSMVPFFSPILMYVRIVAHTPPMWQIALSIGLLLVTMWLVVLLCSRIYRVGILMYGKKPTLPEIVKWVKYA